MKDTIADFLRRVIKGEATSSGIKLEMQSAIQSAGKLDENVIAQKDKNKISEENIPEEYRDEFDSARKVIERGYPDGDSNKVLGALRLYSVASTERRFERIHRIIFGSQLSAVVQVNMLGGRVPMHILQNQYKLATQQFPEFYNDIDFDTWISFPITVNLLRAEVEPNGDRFYIITASGKAYLHYIIALNLPPRSY